MPTRPRLRPPRRIRPGTASERRPGSQLSCAVLAAGPDEWAGVDLGSGAFVRARPGTDGHAAVAGSWSMFDVALIEIGDDSEPPDPARPEAIDISREPERAGRLRRRAARRLLRHLVAPEMRWHALLGTRGPSVAYVDLDATAASIVLIATSPKSLRCQMRHDGEVVASFAWAGTTQVLPLLDPRVSPAVRESQSGAIEPAALALAIGGKPGYLLVGLAAIRGGHAPKAVLSIIPKHPRPPRPERSTRS